MLIPPCRMQRKASAAVMTKGIVLPVWVSASTDSKSPVPIHATSRSVHSHSIGRAFKFSGYRYIVFLPKVKPQVCARGFCVFYSSFPASFSSRSMRPRMKSFCFRPVLAR